MKITVHNLGPIAKGTVDFKPLTIFVGPNNTGKTYVAYLIYALTSKKQLTISSLPECRKLVQGLVSNLFQEVDAKYFLKNLSISKTFKVDDILTPDTIQKLINSLLEHDIPNKVFPQIFGVSQFQRFKLYIDPPELDILVQKVQAAAIKDIDIEVSSNHMVDDVHLQVSYTKPKGSRFIEVSIKLSGIVDTLDLSTFKFLRDTTKTSGTQEETSKNPVTLDEDKVLMIFQEYLPEAVLPDLILEHVFIPAFTQSLYRDTIVFPIYRHAFALFSVRSQLEYAKAFDIVRVLYKFFKKETEPNMTINYLPGIIRDYISLLNELASAVTSSQKGMPSLAEIAETLLLEGNHIELRKEPRSGPYILYSQGSTTLELERSSSMVQQLSPLILYLRFLAKKGDLVIIDEPESNLHPEAQIRIAQLIVRMVNEGLNVVITTHSPYIAEYINMLMDAYKILLKKPKTEKEKVEAKIKTTFEETLGIAHPGSIWNFLIPPEKVSAYFFGNSTICSLRESKEDSFDWRTFADLSERIEQLYNHLVLLDINLEP